MTQLQIERRAQRALVAAGLDAVTRVYRGQGAKPGTVFCRAHQITTAGFTQRWRAQVVAALAAAGFCVVATTVTGIAAAYAAKG